MNLKALKELAAKVEAGQFIPRFDGPEHRVWPGMEGMNSWKRHHARYSYHGSLDAAKALHDAVLPGWVYGLNFDAHDEKYAFVSDGNYETDEIYCECHARAWLLAILRALIAQEESNG